MTPAVAGRRPFSRRKKYESTKKNHEQDCNRKHGRRPHRVNGPEKINPLQVAQEQRRIAERCQDATNGRYKKNKKNHHMGVERAGAIGANERLDQDHRGAGRPDDVRDRGAKGEDRCIDRRRAVEPAFDSNASRCRVERKKHEYERQISERHAVHETGRCSRQPFYGDKASKRQDRPKQSRLLVMDMPPFLDGERSERD